MMDMYGKRKAPVTTTRMAARTLCAAFVLVLLAGATNAETLINSCTTINEPGEYRLTADIINSTISSCIKIASNDVLFNGTGYTIDGVTDSPIGIEVNNVENITITNIKLTNCFHGIWLMYVSNGTIKNVSLNSNGNTGIILLSSSDNKLINNTVNSTHLDLETGYGIVLSNSDNNTLNYNNIYYNDVGISSYSSDNNIIFNNRFINNNNFDISSSNITWNATKTLGTNIIEGPYLGGNYWGHPNGTGFSQTCIDGNSDGICDSPYVLDSNNSDYLPLANAETLISSCTTINDPGEYRLTVDIINSTYPSCINITTSDVIIDGEGHTIDGIDSGSTFGIYIYNSTMAISNISIKNFTITDWAYGIFSPEKLSDGFIEDNIAFSNGVVGLHLHSSNYSYIGNIANSNFQGIDIFGDNNNLINNIANSNEDIGIFITGNNNSLINNTANSNQNQNGIRLYYCNISKLENNTANSNGNAGIYLHENNKNNILINNSANSNGYGIRLDAYNDNNSFSNNTANLNQQGINLGGLNINNTFTDNTIRNNGFCGIWFRDSNNNNTLANNSIDSNYGWGIRIDYSHNNTISDNFIQNNTDSGIIFDSSKNNSIYNNRFINIKNFEIISSDNIWNTIKTSGTNIIDGPYLGGNFWGRPNGTGYSQTCIDGNSDGICDSPYILDSNNSDYLPLANKTGQKNISTCTAINYPSYYVLTSDIANSSATSCINITSNNVVFDGLGHTIDGIGASDGIHVHNSTKPLRNITIKNLKFTDWYNDINYHNTANGIIANCTGIHFILQSSDNNTLINNTLMMDFVGIELRESNNNTLIKNIAYGNPIAGIALVSSNFNTLESNTVYSSENGIYLLGSSNNNKLIENNVSSNFANGICIDGGDNNNLISNIANSNLHGIYISHGRETDSKNNTLINNTVNLNEESGIFLIISDNNTLINNTANLNKFGISLQRANYNNILVNNTANLNDIGILLSLGNGNNTLINNVISFNNNYGIQVVDSDNDNTIYNNHFSNVNNFYISSSNNTWNTTQTPGTNIIGGPYLGGNLWAKPDGTGFSQTCADDNGDGICDSSYSLDPNNTDYLPLKLKLANITGFGFGTGNGVGTPGSWINATVNVTNLDIAAHTYVIVVSGVSIDGYPLATTATLTLTAEQSMSNIPVLVSIPPTTPPGSYNLIAGIWKLEDFPISSRLITSMGPITATVT